MKLIAPEQLSKVWPRVEAWINEAVKVNQGDENLLDVLIAIARGHYLLFEGPTFAVVGQVQPHPQQTVGMILYCGGSDMAGIAQGFEEGKQWCKANGISVMRTFGRPGWAKVLDLMPAGVILQINLKES